MTYSRSYQSQLRRTSKGLCYKCKKKLFKGGLCRKCYELHQDKASIVRWEKKIKYLQLRIQYYKEKHKLI